MKITRLEPPAQTDVETMSTRTPCAPPGAETAGELDDATVGGAVARKLAPGRWRAGRWQTGVGHRIGARRTGLDSGVLDPPRVSRGPDVGRRSRQDRQARRHVLVVRAEPLGPVSPGGLARGAGVAAARRP